MDELLEYELEAITLQEQGTMRPRTAQEYLTMPEGAPYFQFINGEVVDMPAPILIHQQVISNLNFYFKLFLKQHQIAGTVFPAPVDVYFTDTDYFQPDLAFVSNERSSILQNRKNIKGAPDLVVEVLSPSTGYYDLTHKKFVYEQEGVREYWLVYPEERRVEVYVNSANGFILHSQAVKQGTLQSSVLSGFETSIDAVFE
ncbi:MAG: Uma2 family endonuclease [Candidatus Kapaibacterium sp.]|nr:MAG: Uma2 family endonuclease [Candidatus Kapabacteria bacterium]